MTTETEIRAEFEKSCGMPTKGPKSSFIRAKKDREYLKEGDYILSDMRIAWKIAEPLYKIIAAKDAEIMRLRRASDMAKKELEGES